MDRTASYVFREKTPYELADPANRRPFGPSNAHARARRERRRHGRVPVRAGGRRRLARGRRQQGRSAAGGARRDRRRCQNRGTAARERTAAALLLRAARRARGDRAPRLPGRRRESAVGRRGDRAGGRKTCGVEGAMSSLSVGSAAGAPITITGLADGLDTSSIISALMDAEREPVTRLTDSQGKLQAQETALQSIQSSLQQLVSAVSEFSLPSLFESEQTVTSNEPARVSAATTAGAGVGGYEVEVTQLADSAQRTFTFTSPSSEQELTIDGHEFEVKEGESAQSLASEINSTS